MRNNMKPKHQRLLLIIISLAMFSTAIAIILKNFNDNLLFFYSPTQFIEKNIANDKLIRVGGLVKEGSIIKTPETFTTEFTITDIKNEMVIKYTGTVPVLFREQQGIIARGRFNGQYFDAEELLAKHDENYMPPEIANTMIGE